MKRIGRLNNKPVVIGNENKLTKNEILLKNDSDNKFSLSVNKGGGTKLITGGSSYKYYKFDIQQYTQDMIAKYNSEMMSLITAASVDLLPFGFYVYFKPVEESGAWSLNGYHNGFYAQEENGTFTPYLTPAVLMFMLNDKIVRDFMDLSKPIYLIDNPLLYSIIIKSGDSFVQSPLDRRSPYEHIKFMIDSIGTGENKEVLNHMVDYIIPITKEEFDQAIQTK